MTHGRTEINGSLQKQHENIGFKIVTDILLTS